MKTPPTVRVEERPGDTRTIKTHPSFVLSSFHRISGSSGERLFGSEIDSGHFIRFEVFQAEEHWHLHQKWYHCDTRPLITVDMTAAQFAEMITTMNAGQGIPTTLRRLDGRAIEDFTDQDTLQSQIKSDIKKSTESVTASVAQLRAEVEAALSTVGKAKRDAVLGLISKIQMELNSNMPFIVDQYKEAVDKVTSGAKSEIDSFLTHVTSQLGVKSLQDITKAQEKLEDSK